MSIFRNLTLVDWAMVVFSFFLGAVLTLFASGFLMFAVWAATNAFNPEFWAFMAGLAILILFVRGVEWVFEAPFRMVWWVLSAPFRLFKRTEQKADDAPKSVSWRAVWAGIKPPFRAAFCIGGLAFVATTLIQNIRYGTLI
ncbi:MAG: hypothetical protein AAF386_13485 [Pseudomonadota bacterium]